ncbi:hypothetical protein U1Q18_052110 [Sarracenia purpurea var. burkii]
MRAGRTPSRIKRAMRKVMTRVLPEPAPAKMSSGPPDEVRLALLRVQRIEVDRGGHLSIIMGGSTNVSIDLWSKRSFRRSNGKYYDYVLDTKGRKLPDTPEGKTEKLEVVLYTDYNDKARIVDRSSVNVRIGNQANIPVPNSVSSFAISSFRARS